MKIKIIFAVVLAVLLGVKTSFAVDCNDGFKTFQSKDRDRLLRIELPCEWMAEVQAHTDGFLGFFRKGVSGKGELSFKTHKSHCHKRDSYINYNGNSDLIGYNMYSKQKFTEIRDNLYLMEGDREPGSGYTAVILREIYKQENGCIITDLSFTFHIRSGDINSVKKELKESLIKKANKNFLFDGSLCQYGLSQEVKAETILLKKGAFQLFEYIYEGQMIQRFEVPTNYWFRNNPMLMAECAIFFNNPDQGDEGRYFSSDQIDIYCGKNPVIKIVDKRITNHFGTVRIESKDKKWAVFIPENDSNVPGYSHLSSNGKLTTVDISKYWYIISHKEKRESENKVSLFPDAVLQEDTVVVNGIARDISIPNNNERQLAKLTIFEDGTYQISFPNRDSNK
jgi:hypothetical protein